MAKVPIEFDLPEVESDREGRIVMEAEPSGEGVDRVTGKAKLSDEFGFRVIVVPDRLKTKLKVGLIPSVPTVEMLGRLGIEFVEVDPSSPSPPDIDLLIVGEGALRADEYQLERELEVEGGYSSRAEAGLPPPHKAKIQPFHALPLWLGEFVERGGRVLVLAQTERVLSRWFGFRTAWPGTRRVFVRCPWHPVMRGLDDELLSLWRGSSHLTYSYTSMGPVGDPAVDWLGFKNTRVWKWGSYGTVASVVIEKPHLGDFLSLADCEFDLNYTPLLEYRRGRGLILFCQLDLCSRSEPEPVVKRVFENLLSYLENPFEKRSRRTIYVGGREGEELLKALKVRYELAPPSELRGGDLLIVGPGGGDALRAAADRVAEAVRKGMIVLCLGLDPDELEGWLPFEVRLARREVLFTPIGRGDPPFLRGIGPSELHWRGRIKIWAVEGVPEGGFRLSTGVFAAVPFGKGWLVFLQATPDMFDEESRPYLRLSKQRCAQMVSRVLANCGAAFDDPLLKRISAGRPVRVDLTSLRWRLKPDPEGEGERLGWNGPGLDESDWIDTSVPGYWEDQVEGLKEYDGVVWYRARFVLPEELPDDRIELVIGAVDDEDWVFINGHLIGHTGRDTHPENWWAAERRYKVPREVLNSGGENVIAVKVLDLGMSGGIARGPFELRSAPRWLRSYYINTPIAEDDPYRYYRW
ncbi:hypothetical protein DRP77_10390 [Candidatus Poribacteria bacterium]|nr:MAG: hypothetical protein DRP77_10390 [Candidatus Poribacteria bacterium]